VPLRRLDQVICELPEHQMLVLWMNPHVVVQPNHRADSTIGRRHQHLPIDGAIHQWRVVLNKEDQGRLHDLERLDRHHRLMCEFRKRQHHRVAPFRIQKHLRDEIAAVLPIRFSQVPLLFAHAVGHDEDRHFRKMPADRFNCFVDDVRRWVTQNR